MILMYHNVVPENAPAGYQLSGLTLTRTQFQHQITFLATFYKIVALETYLEHFLKTGRRPWRTLAITFDDGTAATFETVYPILTAQKVPFAIFATTSHLIDGEMMWGSYLNALCYEDIYPAISIGEVVLPLGSAAERRQSRVQLHELALRNNDPFNFTRALAQSYPLPDNISAFYQGLTLEQLRLAGKSDLVEVGSHTVNHPFLSRLPVTEQEGELRESRQMLSDMTGRPARYLSYPSGDYTADTLKLLPQTGYTAAFAVKSRKIGSRPEYEMDRQGVYAPSLPKLFAKASGLTEIAARMRSRSL